MNLHRRYRPRRSRWSEAIGKGSRRAARQRGLRLESLEPRMLLTTYVVDSLDDTVASDNQITLREALQAANTDAQVNEAPAGTGADTINFAAALFAGGPGTITLLSGELAITDALTINGPGRDLLTIDGDQLFRVFNVDDDDPDNDIEVTISDVTITRGSAGDEDGGGIRSLEDLTLNRVRVTANFAFFDGGIYTEGSTLEVNDSIVSGNLSNGDPANDDLGAGIRAVSSGVTVVGGEINANVGVGISAENNSTVTVIGTTISGNSGGVSNDMSAVQLDLCTLLANIRYGVETNYGDLVIVASTIADTTAAGGFGGGVVAFGIDGSVSISGSTISNNQGGGVTAQFAGSLDIVDSTIADNVNLDPASASGGGVYAVSTPLTISGSTISGNDGGNVGGGIFASGGSLSIRDTTVSGNTADQNGGGIFSTSGSVTIANATVSGNTATNNGGGLYLASTVGGETWTIANTTIADNDADLGGGVFVASGAPVATNSIFGDNTAINGGSDINGVMNGGFNLIEDPTDAILPVPNVSNIIGVDPVLGPLADNGGTTLTHALLPGSPAIEAGDPAFDPAAFVPPLNNDQRGSPRVFDANADGTALIDIGAFELLNLPPVAVDDGYTVDEDVTLVIPALGVLDNDSDPDGNPIAAVLATGTSNGTLTLQNDGSFTYTPDPEYHGPDSFTYLATDGVADSNVATVAITVDPVWEGVIGGSLFDDANANGIRDAGEGGLAGWVVELENLSVPGPVVNVTDASGDYSFTDLEPGTYEVRLVVQAGYTQTLPANNGVYTLVMGDDTILPGNDFGVINDLAPVVEDDAYVTLEGTTLNVSAAEGVLANDFDPDGDPHTAVPFTGPADGTLTLNLDGSFTYTPNAGFFGVDTFTYAAADMYLESPSAEVRIIVPRPLGTVDLLQLPDHDLTGGELWYQLQTAHEAFLTAVAAFDAGGGDAEMALYGWPLDPALVDAGPDAVGRRLDRYDDAGETFYLRLSGSNADVDVTLVDLVHVEGDNVTVFGTAGDDEVTLESNVNTGTVGAITRRVTVAGVPYDFSTPVVPNPPTFVFAFNGGGGADIARVIGSTGDETGTIDPGSGTFEGFALTAAVSAETIIFDGGGGGDDVFLLNDSPGDDLLVAGPDGATLSGPGYTSSALDAPFIHAYARRDGHDVARFHDSTGDDQFLAQRLLSWMQGPGFFVRGKFFDEVYAESVFGTDTAQFRDTPGNEQFSSSAGTGRMIGVGFLYEATGFRYLHAYGSKGYDTGSLTDSPGNDEFRSWADGPVPISFLTDRLTYFVRVKNLDVVVGYANDGDDLAILQDSPYDDTLQAYPDVATLSGPGHYNRVFNFEVVRSLAGKDGRDMALLNDSSGDDTFTATPTWSTLVGPAETYRLEAYGFDYVHGYGSLGLDTAFFFDSPGDDMFFGTPGQSYMRGDGFFNRAKLFEVVYADASEDGNDCSGLFDTPLADSLAVDVIGGQTWARLSSNNATYDYLYEVYAFDQVTTNLGPGDAGPSGPRPSWLAIYGGWPG